MKFLGTLMVMAGTICSLTAQEQTNQMRMLLLEDCIQQALEHNLDLQIERYNPRLSRLNLRSAYSGYDPTFSINGQHRHELSGGGFNSIIGTNTPSRIEDRNSFSSGLEGKLPGGFGYSLGGSISESYGRQTLPFDSTGGDASIDMSQPLLKNFWIDGTRLNIAVAKNNLKSSEQGLRGRIMDVVTSVERAYYDLIAARENIKAQEQGLALAERLFQENRRRVEVGAMAPLDEKQAESQVAARRADLLTARQTLSQQQTTLITLLTDDYMSLYGVELVPSEPLGAVPTELRVQDSWSRGMKGRPDLIQTRLDLENKGIQLRYDKNQLFPQLDLFGTYGHSAGGDSISEFSQGFSQLRRGDQPYYVYGARLSVPLGNVAARNNYKSSKLTVEQALLSLKKLEQDILAEIGNAVISVRVSFERVDSTRQARLYAESALEAEQRKLESGKSTSFTVLQLQRDLTASRSSEIGALADYNKALADLARSEGSTLERRKVDLEVK